jgi:mannose-6-phosphate isomerase-like protein (cupin superfamily)
MGPVQTASSSTMATSQAGHGLAPASHFKVWVDDPLAFSTHRIQPIHHNYHEHPLMQLPELAKLAKDLTATGQCRFIKRETQQSSEFLHGAEDTEGRSIDEVFARIEEPGSWVALYNVETHPAYREFLAEVTASVRKLVEPQQPGMFNVGGFIFISAPPSVTPFHIDRENNFWLQVKGRKTMNVWDHTDRHVVPAETVDKFIVHAGLEDVRLKDGFTERSHEFNVGPGDGVYFPSTSPHMTRSVPDWVRPGDGVSISIGVVFYTQVTRRSANVHAWNLFLRKLGLSPKEPGQSVWLDRLKYPFGRALVGFRKNLRGYRPQVGM